MCTLTIGYQKPGGLEVIDRLISEVIFSEIFLHSTSTFEPVTFIRISKSMNFFWRVWLIVQWTPLRFFPALLFEQWSVTTCRSTWPKSWVDQTWILDIPTKTSHRQVVFLLVNICKFVRTYIVMVIWKILGFISRS